MFGIGSCRLHSPQYAVCIIVDSAADPAWEEVQRILARGHPANVQVRVAVLAAHRETCSPKVSGTLQTIAGLDEQMAARVTLTIASRGPVSVGSGESRLTEICRGPSKMIARISVLLGRRRSASACRPEQR